MIKINLKNSAKTDPLWKLKKKILKVLVTSPRGFCQLELEVGHPTESVLRSLKDMEAVGVVQIRESFGDDFDSQMWGIALPNPPKWWIKLKKLFNQRGSK